MKPPRTVKIPITNGMLRQALVHLNTRRLNNAFEFGEIITITHDRRSFETEISISSLRFKDRKNFNRIFQECAARDGDTMVLTKRANGRWNMKIEKTRL